MTIESSKDLRSSMPKGASAIPIIQAFFNLLVLRMLPIREWRLVRRYRYLDIDFKSVQRRIPF